MISRYLSAIDIAQILSISRASAYREMQQMSHVIVGERMVRVSESAFEAYLRNRTEASRVASREKLGRPIGAAARADELKQLPGSSSGRPVLRPVFPRTRRRTNKL
jgi:predicted DNA-binding transcriptional regulator AlpA